MDISDIPDPNDYIFELPVSEKLANEHVEWFLNIISPLLKAEFMYGYKHGFQDAEKLHQDS